MDTDPARGHKKAQESKAGFSTPTPSKKTPYPDMTATICVPPGTPDPLINAEVLSTPLYPVLFPAFRFLARSRLRRDCCYSEGTE